MHWDRRGAGGQRVQVWWYRRPDRIRSQFESKARTPCPCPALHGRATVLRWCNATRRRTLGTYRRIEEGAAFSVKTGLTPAPPITRARAVGGGGAAAPRARAHTPAAAKGDHADGVPARRRGTGGIICGLVSTSPPDPLLYRWWGSSEAASPRTPLLYRWWGSRAVKGV